MPMPSTNWCTRTIFRARRVPWIWTSTCTHPRLPRMDYVESEMRKRKLGDEGDMSKEGIQKRMVDPADELFQVAEKYRKLQREAQSELPSQSSRPSAEGHSTLSAAMLSKVPEIDLGINARLQNIEATEKAKRELYEKRQSAPKPDAPTGPCMSHGSPSFPCQCPPAVGTRRSGTFARCAPRGPRRADIPPPRAAPPARTGER